jgi:hypothetical protein
MSVNPDRGKKFRHLRRGGPGFASRKLRRGMLSGGAETAGGESNEQDRTKGEDGVTDPDIEACAA